MITGVHLAFDRWASEIYRGETRIWSQAGWLEACTPPSQAMLVAGDLLNTFSLVVANNMCQPHTPKGKAKRSFCLSGFVPMFTMFYSYSSTSQVPVSFLTFALISSRGGSQYSQSTTKHTKPATTVHSPATQGQAALITKLLGHSSWAKCRTVTCRLSSIVVRKGRL